MITTYSNWRKNIYWLPASYSYNLRCDRCGWIVNLHEPHTSEEDTRIGKVFYYHEWCYEMKQ